MKSLWLVFATLCLIGCAANSESEQPTAGTVTDTVKMPSVIVRKRKLSASELEEQRAVIARLQKLKAADPVADFKKAWGKADFRFVAVYGVGAYFPGIDNWGNDAGFLSLAGYRVIKGTTDFVAFPEQNEFNNVAWEYAEKYNKLLIKKLRAEKSTNPAVRHMIGQVEQELCALERADPRADFHRDVKKGDLWFIDLGTGVEGVDEDELDKLKFYKPRIKDFKCNALTMTKMQKARFRPVIKRYIKPYNRMMFRYLKTLRKRQKLKPLAH